MMKRILADRETALELELVRLRIAAITLTRDATLLARKTTDFREIPFLKFEDGTA